MKMHKLNPLPCLGGKFNLIKIYVLIIEHIAKQYNLSAYIEGCGGGAKMLTNLDTTLFNLRVYNEIELGVANYFATLTNPQDTHKLIAKLDSLLHNCNPKKLFDLAFDNKDLPETDRITSAAYAYITAHGSFSANRTSFSDVKFEDSLLRNQSYHNLSKFNPIFENVKVTSGDCFNLLNYYSKRQDFFILVDPPYVGTKSYKHNWTDDKHRELVKILLNTNMKVMLCGIENNIYTPLQQNGWHAYSFKNYFSSTDKMVDDWIWTNFPIPMGYVSPMGGEDVSQLYI